MSRKGGAAEELPFPSSSRLVALGVAMALSAALPAFGEDGGDTSSPSPSIDRPEYRCPEAPEASVRLDGGWWVPEARERRLTCLMASCAAHRASLEESLDRQGEVETWWIVTAAILGVAVGGIAGVYLTQLVRR